MWVGRGNIGTGRGGEEGRDLGDEGKGRDGKE